MIPDHFDQPSIPGTRTMTDFRFTLKDAQDFRADLRKPLPPVTTPRKAEEARALTVGGDSAGIIAPDYRSKMLGKFDDANLISKLAYRVDMGTEKVSFPRVTARPITTIDAEQAAWTASDPTHDSVVLQARKLRSVTICSNEWLADATIDGIDHLATVQAGSMAAKVDHEAFVGGGLGSASIVDALTAAGRVVSCNAGNSNAGVADTDDFLNALGALPNYARKAKSCCIVMSRWAYFASAKRLLVSGGGNNKFDLAGALPTTFFGYPVHVTDELPSAGGPSEILAVVGDFAGVLYGDRREISTRTFDQVLAQTDQTAVATSMRAAVEVADPAGLVVLKTAAA